MFTEVVVEVFAVDGNREVSCTSCIDLEFLVAEILRNLCSVALLEPETNELVKSLEVLRRRCL